MKKKIMKEKKKITSSVSQTTNSKILTKRTLLYVGIGLLIGHILSSIIFGIPIKKLVKESTDDPSHLVMLSPPLELNPPVKDSIECKEDKEEYKRAQNEYYECLRDNT